MNMKQAGVALLTLALSVAFSGSAFAGASFQNPDVDDLNTGNLNATGGTDLDYNVVQVRAGQSGSYYSSLVSSAYAGYNAGTYVKGYAGGSSSSGSNSMHVTWFAFEPDSIRRNNRGASINQSSSVALGVAITGDYSSTRTAVVEKCRVRSSTRTEKDTTDVIRSSSTLRCRSSVWEDLGFGVDEVEAIRSVIGRSTSVRHVYREADAPMP